MTMPSWLAPASLAIAFFVALAWRGYALRRGHVDLPGERRLHQVPTPRGGGLGIALALLLATPWLGDAGPGFALGLLACAGGGLLDDLRPLSPGAKLALQVAGAACLAWSLPLWPGLWGDMFGRLAATVLVVGLVNAWNFMDGSNGMATSQAVFASIALALLAPAAPGLVPLAVTLAAAGLGFLPLNFPRARLFLGDVGSHALGYAVAAALLLAAGQGGDLAWLAWLPLSPMLVDAGLTLLSRARRRRTLWQAHREHLYQRAVAHGLGHAAVCAIYAAWVLLASALALAAARWPAPWPPLAAVAGVGAGLVLHHGLGRRWPRQAEPRESMG